MDDPDVLRRRTVDSLISNICSNYGFQQAETAAIQTLSEMFVSCNLPR